MPIIDYVDYEFVLKTKFNEKFNENCFILDFWFAVSER